MENWFYLPPRIRGLEPGTSFQIGAEEVGDGEDLGTAGAFTADAHFSAHQIALVTALVSQEALVARRALVHGPIDKSLRLMQLVREPGQRWLLRLTATESKSALAAGWAAIHAAALDRERPVAHRACAQLELWSVTAIVTHGHGAHAPTASARGGASSRTN